VQHGSTEIGVLEQVGFAQSFEFPSLYSVRVTGEYGFAVGDLGAIFYSTDRGRTWARQPVPSDWGGMWFRDVSAVAGTHGLIVGVGGQHVLIQDGKAQIPSEQADASEAVH
jgi:photosystem II stability/assembly factor-like uncharacterized protein